MDVILFILLMQDVMGFANAPFSGLVIDYRVGDYFSSLAYKYHDDRLLDVHHYSSFLIFH